MRTNLTKHDVATRIHTAEALLQLAHDAVIRARNELSLPALTDPDIHNLLRDIQQMKNDLEDATRKLQKLAP